LENSKTVLAIDPGKSKCGLALVRRDADENVHLIWHCIVPRDAILPKLQEAHDVEAYSLIVVGNGTTSKPLIHEIREAMPSMAILVVDEKETTLQARERYWEYNPRRGWRRLGPATMFMPPVPIDDYAAMVIAERVLIA
jgi:RNase H-fold protein (predicted Holliday junction resolvase)